MTQNTLVPRAIVHDRISTTGQFRGDSLENQEEVARRVATKKYGYKPEEIITFNEIYTGTMQSRPEFEEMMEFAFEHKETIERVFITKIDRFSRAGPSWYEQAKKRLKDMEIELVDVEGVIQPEENSLKGIGEGWGDDLVYPWSVKSPSEDAEIIKAQYASSERKAILEKLVSANALNTRNGYEPREAGYGFRNTKTLTTDGKIKPTREIVPSEARFSYRMYEWAAQNVVDVRLACDELNATGFRTRSTNRWNKNRTKVVGLRDGIPLTPKQFWRIVENVANAGFKSEKWTWNHLVKAPHEPIVSVDLWNRANRGKWKIVEDGSLRTGWRLIDLRNGSQRAYRKLRSDFPFKGLLLCSDCRCLLWAASSRGKLGKLYPYYFCNRGHKQVSIKPIELEEKLRSILRRKQFSKPLIASFETAIRERWETELERENRGRSEINGQIEILNRKRQEALDRLDCLQNPSLIQHQESQFEEIENQIAVLEAKRTQAPGNVPKLDNVLKRARQILENPEALIFDTHNHHLLAGIWNCIFAESPTVHQIRTRTPKFSLVMETKKVLNTKGNCGGATGIPLEPDLAQKVIKELVRWATILEPLDADFAGATPFPTGR